MSERQCMLGERVELRQRRQRQEAACVALRDKLRGLLPVTAETAELDADAILDTAVVLHTELDLLAGLDKKLAVLNRELGA